MPRFVILRHEPGPQSTRPLHWDLLFEFGDSLRSWAVEREPVRGQSIPALQLPDHRHAYLDYEGIVSGGRGTVAAWDRGEFLLRETSPTLLVADLAGERLQGAVRLCAEDASGQRWIVEFEA